jgi:hypothetical protein
MYFDLSDDKKKASLVVLTATGIGEECSLDTVEIAARDSSGSIRTVAAGQLWAFGPEERVLATLRKLLSDPEPVVQAAARHSLNELTSKERSLREHQQ